MKTLDCTKCKNLNEVDELYDKTATAGNKSTFPVELLFTEELARELWQRAMGGYPKLNLDNFDCYYRGVPVKVIRNKE